MRLAFADAAGDIVGGIDITEAGTKRLAVYVVRAVEDVPGITAWGQIRCRRTSPRSVSDEIPTRQGQADQGRSAEPINHRGIGNAYSDEIPHAARISPFAAAGRLTADQREALFTAIRGQLYAAIARAAGSAPETLKSEKKAAMAVHGRTGEACPVCGDVVREVSFADSSLQYCATCQTDGKVLADRRMSRLLRAPGGPAETLATAPAAYPPLRWAARNARVCTIMLAAAISLAYSARKRGSPISSRRTSTVCRPPCSMSHR